MFLETTTHDDYVYLVAVAVSINIALKTSSTPGHCLGSCLRVRRTYDMANAGQSVSKIAAVDPVAPFDAAPGDVPASEEIGLHIPAGNMTINSLLEPVNLAPAIEPVELLSNPASKPDDRADLNRTSNKMPDGRSAKNSSGESESDSVGREMCDGWRAPSGSGSDVVTFSMSGCSDSETDARGRADASCHDRDATIVGVNSGQVGAGTKPTAVLPKGCVCSSGAETLTTAQSIEPQPTVSPESTVRVDRVGVQPDGTGSSCDEVVIEHKTLPPPTHQSPRESCIVNFKELLEQAVRQSDAELAADKESASACLRLQSMARAEATPSHQQGGMLGPQHPATAAKTGASDYCDGNKEQRNCERRGGGVAGGSSDLPSTTALVPGQKPNDALAEGHWVRYVSPDGYPYLYNSVTHKSEWVANEEESFQHYESAVNDSHRITVNTKPEMRGGGGGDRDGKGINCGVYVTSEGMGKDFPEAESVGTCEASQSSQDTSDPDVRYDYVIVYSGVQSRMLPTIQMHQSLQLLECFI